MNSRTEVRSMEGERPIGMGLFLAGIAWLELRPRREEARHAASLQRT